MGSSGRLSPSRADTGGSSGGSDSAPNPQRCPLRAPPAPTAWPAPRARSALNPADCCYGPGPVRRAPNRRDELRGGECPFCFPGRGTQRSLRPFPGGFAFLPRSSGWQTLDASGSQRAGRLISPRRATGAVWDHGAPKPNFSSLRSLGGRVPKGGTCISLGDRPATWESRATGSRGLRVRRAPPTASPWAWDPRARTLRPAGGGGDPGRMPKSHARTRTSDRRGLSRPRETSRVGWRGSGE